MRPYRGLTKDGKWVYGWYAIIEDEHIIIPDTATLCQSRIVTFHDFIEGYIEVLPETVGQATGLKDKNGKEIYEGDIVEFGTGLKKEKAVIEFQEHCYNAGFYPDKSANAACYWEIIGNIHEGAGGKDSCTD